MQKKYDVGVIGLWYGRNYGSMVTYYALHNIIKEMGYSVLMIDNPLGEENFEVTKTHPYRIANMFYDISERISLDSLSKLNELCNTFVVGSDQLWNVGLSRPYKQMYYLGFADDSVKKISYGTSFGRDYMGTEAERSVSAANLARFDGVSVRDELSLEICRNTFEVDAVQVCDPTLLCDVSVYDALAAKVKKSEKKQYILAYVLDPNPHMGRQLEQLSIEKNIKVVIVLDEAPTRWVRNFEALQLSGKGNVEVKREVDLFEWLWYYQNASCVFTDSFHGTIFSIIFKKPFVTLVNYKRGAERFYSLLNPLGLQDRLIDTVEDITAHIEKYNSCDYDEPYAKLNEIKSFSYQWLKERLNEEKKDIINVKNTASLAPNLPETAYSDLMRCKILATLLKQYGIKHIVLSSGSGHINLVKLFEAEPFFKTYSVIDERSAGFFAMGLALKLNRTVALCCTSGTATLNYLSAITEAFHQNVPLVVITADGYPCGVGQCESQTVPQAIIYANVVKKSVTLPVTGGDLNDCELRRLICDALLEVNHHGKGPVHINVPISDLEQPILRPSLLKLDKKYRTIERITAEDSDELWLHRVEGLRKLNRILIVYGQSHPLTEAECRSIETFAEKFNCVIVTDALSNYSGKHTFLSTPILEQYDADRFEDELWADAVITIGGRRSLNDPLKSLLKAQKKYLGHWRVAEDGCAFDPYRNLTKIFECSPQYFFNKFTELAGNIHNNGRYEKAWADAQHSLIMPRSDSYSQLYAVERFIESLPDNSLLHLAMGCTIMFANSFKINPSVNVFCNMNGIDGSASTFMGQCAASSETCFLIISDLSFFYDMNSIWSKELHGNIRIMLCNNSGTNLLKHHKSKAITHNHSTSAKAWVKSVGFTYLSAENKEEFEENLCLFTSDVDVPIFFEVFC